MAGNGLQGSLIGVRSETEGFSVTVAGFVMAAYFAGFLFGSRVAESLIANVGHIRVFAGLASMASTAVLIHALFIDPITWGLMRFVTGLCMAGLYVTEESWLNDLATNATRGRLLSRYMIVTMGGMTIGQFLLDVADPDGVKLFLLASVLVSASLIPVVLSASSNPPLVVPERMSLRELACIVPFDFVCACPTGYEPDADLVARVAERGVGTATIVTDPVEGVKGADVIYADVWASMGQKEEADERARIFAPYQVNEALMAATQANYTGNHQPRIHPIQVPTAPGEPCRG